MNDYVRLIATGIIWTAFTLIMGFIVAMVSTTGMLTDIKGTIIFTIVLVVAVSATLSTRAVWHASGAESDEQTFKLKRSDPRRIERLIEKLDDDDIYDLETLLLAREREADSQHHQHR